MNCHTSRKNKHISETVLVPQAAMDVPPLSPERRPSPTDSVCGDEPSVDLTSVSTDEPSVDLTAAHEALVRTLSCRVLNHLDTHTHV